MEEKRLKLKKLKEELKNPRNREEDKCRILVAARLFRVFIQDNAIGIQVQKSQHMDSFQVLTKIGLKNKEKAILSAYRALKHFEKKSIEKNEEAFAEDLFWYFFDHEVEDIFKKYMQRPHNK